MSKELNDLRTRLDMVVGDLERSICNKQTNAFLESLQCKAPKVNCVYQLGTGPSGIQMAWKRTPLLAFPIGITRPTCIFDFLTIYPAV